MAKTKGKEKAISKLGKNAQDLEEDDLIPVIDAEIASKGMVHHHVSTFDEFISVGLGQIVEKLFEVKKSIKNERDRTEEDRKIETIDYNVVFDKVTIGKPTTAFYKSGKMYKLMPSLARSHNLTYTASMYVYATVTAKAWLKGSDVPITREEKIKNFRIAAIPIMVRSEHCNTRNYPREALKENEEDPLDEGGYFIINGTEWVINNIESRSYNQFHAFRNVGYSNEICRGEFISKPGDAYENSKELKILYVTSGLITCEITAIYFTDLKIPFYLIFRLLGMVTDREIMSNIVYGYGSSVSRRMVQILGKAFRVRDPKFAPAIDMRDPSEILDFLAELMTKHSSAGTPATAKSDESRQKYLRTNLLRLFDIHLLPHIGLDKAARPKKLRFLGHLINKLLLVEQEIVPSTDRDSLRTKRINAAGQSYAKILKTQFNLAIVQAISKKLSRDFKAMPFSSVPLAQSVMTSVKSQDLERALIQAITSGDKQISIGNRQITNRLASQQLHRKNQLNVLSVLRTIRTPSTPSSKAAERATDMRKVHPSYTGYICVVQSADTGDTVGLVKQMALSASICSASSSEFLKMTLRQDPDIAPLDKVAPEHIFNDQLGKIFVNGDWVGCTAVSHKLVRKYREIRRAAYTQQVRSDSPGTKIHPLTTIYWDTITDEIQFWVDAGRMMRPLLIVRNNVDNPELFGTSYKAKKGTGFVQDIVLGQRHVQDLLGRKISIRDLQKAGMIEYISPEEQENCYIAQSLDTLKDAQNDPLHRYTHCEIPVSIMGVVALTSPLCEHNAVVRVVYQTNQTKQTCGWYSLNWPYRIDKNQFLQYAVQTPIVTTLSNRYMYPNGMNAVVAIACYGGYNQEDSLIMNQAAIDRGLFVGSEFTFIKTELEKGETFGNPDEARTIDIKSRASYEHLKNGLVKRGTLVRENDVLIGKRLKIDKPRNEQYIWRDRSILYKSQEEAYVETVIKARNQESEQFCKVKLRAIRAPDIGDKMCLRSSAEVLTKLGWKKITDISLEDEVATLVDNYCLEYVNPTAVHSFDHDGDMYHVKTRMIDLTVTMDHKMYVKKRGKHAEYELIKARDIHGKRVRYKKNAEIYDKPEQDTYTICAEKENEEDLEFEMDAWLEFLGMFIADGSTKSNHKVVIGAIKPRKIKRIKSVCKRLNINVCHDYRPERFKSKNSKYGNMNGQHVITRKRIYKEIKPLSVEASQKFLPRWVFNLNQRQSKILLDSLMSCDGTVNSHGSQWYYTSSLQLAEDVAQLMFHCGYSAKIKKTREVGAPYNIKGQCGTCKAPMFTVTLNRSCNEPWVNHTRHIAGNIEEVVHYTGTVHCIEVPSHVFYVRESYNKPPCWTGNSSRHGQKGVIGMVYPQSDMPFTESGIQPDIIMNPHAVPSRMTHGQLLEGLLGKVCALKGSFTDGTAFRKIDIESIADDLEKRGFERYGNERMYNGMTGEWMDTEIFITPTYYQRLQKFVRDEVYSISTGPTDIITRQHLDGKKSRGGLRIGEMEKDCLMAHGTPRFLMEKFLNDSDLFYLYVCRICGKRPIVNERLNIYRCKVCGDNAEIYKVRSAWSTGLLLHEMDSMNIGVRLGLKPHTYEANSS